MNDLRITRCVGEGQCSCRRCEEIHGWNRIWTSMAYKIEGYEGVYCSKCVEAIKEQENE